MRAEKARQIIVVLYPLDAASAYGCNSTGIITDLETIQKHNETSSRFENHQLIFISLAAVVKTGGDR